MAAPANRLPARALQNPRHVRTAGCRSV